MPFVGDSQRTCWGMSQFEWAMAIVAVFIFVLVVWALVRTFQLTNCGGRDSCCDDSNDSMSYGCLRCKSLGMSHYVSVSNPLVNQSIPDTDVDTTVVLPTITGQSDFLYNTTTGTYTAPVAGKYLFTAVIGVLPGVTPGNISLLVNSPGITGSLLVNTMYLLPTDYVGTTLSGELTLAANQEFYLQVAQETGSAIEVGGTISVTLINATSSSSSCSSSC